MNKKTKKGFTLIELLIVIAIIGVLAVAFLPTLLGAPAKARDAQRVSSLQTLQAYFTDRMLAGHALPGDDGGASLCLAPGEDNDVVNLINDNLPRFGGVFPADPVSDIGPDVGNTKCEGGFGYKRFYIEENYAGVVWARLEDTDNANANCSDVDDWTGMDAADWAWDEDEETHSPCHAVIIQ